jgi:hypothetical protein
VLLSDRAPPVSTVTPMASDPNLLSSPQHVKYFYLAPIRIVTNSSIGSLYHDDDMPPSSQDPSHDPRYTPSQSWAVDKISVLQTDITTTKVQLDHLKESVDTRIGNFQNNLENSFARTISNLDSKFASKVSALEFKIDSKFDKIDSKFEMLKKDIKHVVVELTAEIEKKETRLVWRIFFTVSVVLILLYPSF